MQKPDQKQKILECATYLFARFGYNAVGVRQIAKEAGVNISMINYYFGSKLGILKEIIEFTLLLMKTKFTKNVTKDDTFAQRVRKLSRALVNIIRKHTDYFLVFYTQLYFDIPEIAQLKADRLKEIIELIYGPDFLKMYLKPGLSKFRMDILGPTFISVITSHFVLKPIISCITEKKEFDDGFYEDYIEIISEFIIRGIGPEFANIKPENILNKE